MIVNPKCPFCEKPITVWAVLKAPMPWAIRCPHCREKIRVQNVRGFLLGYLFIAVLLIATLIMARRHNLISNGVFIAIPLALLILCEFTVSALVLRYGKFVKPPGKA